ncbi:hypothetical protein Tco_0183141 [Tanacetum coccineum]
METSKPLLKDAEAEDVSVHLYRSMIGSLMYLTASRPDIMFIVCACARFQVKPKVSHLHAVKRIFRYLKGQPNLRHLEGIYVTWAYLEKKQTRLRTNTKTLEDLCSQSLEMASLVLHDAVTTHLVMASQPFLTASACTDSHADLKDSTHEGVQIKT